MALFDKCRVFAQRIAEMQAHDQFFYLREVDPPATPLVRVKGREMIMLGSNNYLGLANHPKVIEAAVRAVREYGTGACSSRLLVGTSSLHVALERRLAAYKGTEDAVVFSTGFMTMMGTLAALTEPGDLVFSDQLNHASIVEGCRLAKAEVRVYRHNDMASLEALLAASQPGRHKLIVTDGVFSMKGSVAELPSIHRLAVRYGAEIMVDDAHGTGVLGQHGRGTIEHFGLEGQIGLVCGTFSKALGTTGGFTAASRDVATFLRLNSRAFLFTASPSPVSVATVLASLDVMEQEPELLTRLRANATLMKAGLRDAGFDVTPTITPIIPVHIGDDERVFRLTGELEREGVLVNPVVPPAVPKDESLVRVSVTAHLTPELIETAIERFKRAGKKVGLLS